MSQEARPIPEAAPEQWNDPPDHRDGRGRRVRRFTQCHCAHDQRLIFFNVTSFYGRPAFNVILVM